MQEAVNRITFLKENNSSDYRVNVIKGERMGIISSWDIEEQKLSDYVVGKNPCKRCRARGNDHSGDNFHFYGEGLGGHCFVCNYTLPSDDWLAEHGEVKEEEYDLVGTEFNEDIHNKLKDISGVDSRNYRGIRSDISKPFGVRYTYREEDGSVAATYYPCTKDSKLVGYKVRHHPKRFEAIGETGKDCDLFMQFKFPTHKDAVVICAGEVDSLTLYQVLADNQSNKKYNSTAVYPLLLESRVLGDRCKLITNSLKSTLRLWCAWMKMMLVVKLRRRFVKYCPVAKYTSCDYDIRIAMNILRKERNKNL